jgi:hypothetical protein
VQNPQCRYWMELRYASFEVVRRSLAENDGDVALSVLRSIIPPVAKARRRKSVKANLEADFAATRSSHTGVRGV